MASASDPSCPDMIASTRQAFQDLRSELDHEDYDARNLPLDSLVAFAMLISLCRELAGDDLANDLAKLATSFGRHVSIIDDELEHMGSIAL